MEYIQENERTPKKDEGGINLRDVVELIIANWYWFVLSVLVCVGSAYFYVLTIQPVYQRQAVMLVKDKPTHPQTAQPRCTAGRRRHRLLLLGGWFAFPTCSA